MTVTFLLLLILGLGMLVRGLMTVSRSRAVWMARSVAATANVVACTPVRNSDGPPFAAFTISVRYLDAQGQPRTADLPAAQEFQTGDPVDVRFDPKHPATVYVSEQFAGTDLPAALIVFGGLLVLVSFSFVTG
jgi:regulator of protease activity HflC (stomatin/prohibitin superfamily)